MSLLFFATTINYIDRQALGLLKDPRQKQFAFSERDYAASVFSFQLAYALGLLLAGRVMDRLGTRKGFALTLIVWSIAAITHAAADWFPALHVPTVLINPPAIVLLSGAAAGFALARFALDLGEAGSFPAAIKTVAEWFPKKERALATGIFNSGSNVGAVITPLVVPWITLQWGWQWAFIATGAIGFFWLIFWLPLYRAPENHPRLSSAELNYIRSDPPEPSTPIPWKKLFPHRQTWAFVVGKFMTDPIWWVYLFWIPDFFKT